MPQQRNAIAAAIETEKPLLLSQDDTMANAERAMHAMLSCITICTDFQ